MVKNIYFFSVIWVRNDVVGWIQVWIQKMRRATRKTSEFATIELAKLSVVKDDKV